MITKLLDSQSFWKVWKKAVRQKFCAILCRKYDHVTLSVDRLGSTSSSLIRWISPQALRKNYVGCLELRLATCNDVKSVVVCNASFRLASRSFKSTGPNNCTFFDRRIEESVLEVITSRKLQHVPRSNEHEAFQTENHKLSLIEQPYLDKIHAP